MTAWAWFAKPFGPGDIAGEGALKLLGKPHLDPLQVLVRETIQNSWDARIPGRTPSWTANVRTLAPAQLELLREDVFAEGGDGTGLKAALEGESVSALEISDRGTSGLGGPLRNDIPPKNGQPTDYVDFVLTMGARRDKSGGAGTYGFGKTISYLASSGHTILIWSHPHGKGKSSLPLLCGSAVGTSFVRAGRTYTGRQWWGASATSDSFEPFRADHADRVGERIFSSDFADGDTGTTLLILAPNLRRDLESTANALVDAVLWNVWPKLLTEPGYSEPPMRISVHLEGLQLDIPDPTKHPRLAGYARALQMLRSEEVDAAASSSPLTSSHSITYHRKEIGRLAIDRSPAMDSVAGSDSSAYSGPGHHVALMRHEAELVVEYRALPAPPYGNFDICGVFRCAQDLDDEFASAEPPAHDAWAWSGLPEPAKGHVRTAERNIKSVWAREVAPKRTEPAQGFTGSTARIANRLQGLVGGASGTGARGGGTGGGGGGKGKGRARARAITGPTVGIAGFDRLSPTCTAVSLLASAPVSSDDLSLTVGIGFDGGTEASHDGQVVVSELEPTGPHADGNPDQFLLWRAVINHPEGIALDVRATSAGRPQEVAR